MNAAALCVELLRLGRAEDFAAIRQLPGAGVHAAVVRLADVHRRDVYAYFKDLATNDCEPFIKALAVYEDTVNGIGSVTLLHELLPTVPDSGHSLFDWILRNTQSYWYYAHSARSYDAYLRECQWRAQRTDINIQRDHERQANDQVRVAQQSTAKLYNAVRRGDVSAVRSLLKRGADPAAHTPDGEPLASFAVRINRLEIASVLQSATPPKHAP